MELGNTSLNLEWRIQSDEFVNITIYKKEECATLGKILGDLSFLAKLTIDSPDNVSGATFLVPVKQVSGDSSQIDQYLEDDLEEVYIKMDKDMLEYLVNQRQGRGNFAFTATISFMALENNLSEKGDHKDVVASEMLKELHSLRKELQAKELHIKELHSSIKELHIKLSDPSSADCTIICHGERLPSHKYILRMRSKVFEVKQLHMWTSSSLSSKLILFFRQCSAMIASRKAGLAK